MAKRTMELCGEIFDVYTGKGEAPVPFYNYNWDEIWECYDRPSITKQAIWHNWCDWVDKMNGQDFYTGIKISSYNYMMFSISGTVCINNKVYRLSITKSYNKLYEY